MIVSDILEAELLRAPDFVKQILVTMSELQTEKVRLSPEAIEFADK